MVVAVVVVEVVEELTVSFLLCKDSREWLLSLTFDLDPMCPLCWANGLEMPLAGLCAADFETTGASDVGILGKEEGFGVDLGKVFADFVGVLDVFLDTGVLVVD